MAPVSSHLYNSPPDRVDEQSRALARATPKKALELGRIDEDPRSHAPFRRDPKMVVRFPPESLITLRQNRRSLFSGILIDTGQNTQPKGWI